MLPLISGCPPSNLFEGRFFVINSTGSLIRSVTLGYPGGMAPHKLQFHDIASGQASIVHDGYVVLGPLELSYIDKTGTPRTQMVPFAGEVPDYCQDDFYIEIHSDRAVRQGLLVYRNYREHQIMQVVSYVLTGAAAFYLGWLILRRRKRPVDVVFLPQKSVTSEL